jgi:uncharacterized Zn finger protein
MGWYDYGGYGGYPPYVSVAERRAKAKRELAKLAKKGYFARPVAIEGRQITTTFWGNSWCANLEGYSDFENRLPRGRTYVRNGSVIDLQIDAGRIEARVMGSSLYRVTIKIKPLAAASWTNVKSCCSGQIGSLVELLQGKLSRGVMDVVTRRDGGLFPKPAEIDMDCSCPDYAGMCKHVAAVLYGVGARLDGEPELLFKLRKVDHVELIAGAGAAAATVPVSGGERRTIEADALADVFGIELDAAPAPVPVPVPVSAPAPSPIAEARSAPHSKPKPRRGAAVQARTKKSGKLGKPAAKRGRAKPDPARPRARVAAARR